MLDDHLDAIRNKLKTYSLELELEPKIEVISDWKNKIDDYCFDFIDSLNNQKAFTYKNNKKFLNLSFDESPNDLDKVIHDLKIDFNDSGIQTASGNYLGFIPGGGLYLSSLADYIVAVTNKYSGVYYGCPTAVDIENSVIKWTCSVIGFPNEAVGNICSGTSSGILYSINVAREAKKHHSNVYSKLVIYCTTVTHGCIFKALKVGGLADAILKKVKCDECYRMLPVELENLIKNDLSNNLIPFMVFSNAGSTDLGSVDPLYEISQISKMYNLWHHVDAAYGGYLMLVESQKYKFKGIEIADSVTLDPHKSLFIPYGCGIVLYRDAKIAKAAFSVNCNCLQDTKNDEVSPADVSIELTKHFRGFRIWLPLQIFGLKAFRDCLEEKFYLSEYFYERVKQIGYKVGPKPQLTIIIFRYEAQNGNDDDSNIYNEKLLELVKRNGKTFLSSTSIEGVYWIRCAILSFRSHLEHIDICLNELEILFNEINGLNIENDRMLNLNCKLNRN